MKTIGLLSCTKTKLTHEASASDIYSSPFFKKAKIFASQYCDDWYIISAKHGILRPDDKIQPYDLNIAQLNNDEIDSWANEIINSLKQLYTNPGIIRIILLADRNYSSAILPKLTENGFQTVCPFSQMPFGNAIFWLDDANQVSARKMHLDVFYNLLSKLHGTKTIDLDPFCPSINKEKLPKSGVYFFLDSAEPRLLSSTLDPRIVRVGTHGVSLGSKATLSSRLKAHKGINSGGGNHRTSIFRLHVGMALLEKHNLASKFPSWGKGQVSLKEIAQLERELEEQVSSYIWNLRCLLVEISDPSSPASDRAYIEKNAIALLSNGGPLDPPSEKWLGQYSPTTHIRESGLWNINHVGIPYDPNFLSVLEVYVNATIGEGPRPGSSLAPSNWHPSRIQASSSTPLPMIDESD